MGLNCWRAEGPVLEDFLDVPRIDQTRADLPVSFPPKQSDNGGWEARLLAEFNLLEPWYQLSFAEKGPDTGGHCPRAA